MYGMLFGQNPLSRVILEMLNLTPTQTGRFRDVFVEDSRIAVYTRNGRGNRGCIHEDSSDEDPFGEEDCKNHSFEREEDEYTKSGWIKPTGRKVVVRRYVCEVPNSAECACYGCIITYRLPKHPLYIEDMDDDFDSTYATVYFKFPKEHASTLSKLASGEWKPSQEWATKFAEVSKMSPEKIKQEFPAVVSLLEGVVKVSKDEQAV